MDQDPRAAWHVGLASDTAAVGFDDLASDRKTETGPVTLGRKKWLEQPRPCRVVQANAFVFYDDV
jgi:hypothetical protein